MKKLEKNVKNLKSLPLENRGKFTILVDEGMRQVKGGANTNPNIGTRDYASCNIKLIICNVV